MWRNGWAVNSWPYLPVAHEVPDRPRTGQLPQSLILKARSGVEFAPGQVATNSEGQLITDVTAELRDPHKVLPGLTVRSIHDNIVTGSVVIDKIEEVRFHENIISLKAALPIHPHLAVTVPDIQATDAQLSALPFPGIDGSGVIIGIVDSGCDFKHPNFRKEDDSSRILFLWDQGPPSSPGANATGLACARNLRMTNGAMMAGGSFSRRGTNGMIWNARKITSD